MARLNARWSKFWATSKTYKHFWQSFPTHGDGTGATLTVTTTLSSVGAVNVSALGTTLTETISLIAGTASVTALGSTLTVTASLASGVATGDALASGATLELTTSLIDGTVNVSADGATLTNTLSLVDGATTVTQPGETLSLNVSVIEGAVNVTADGAALELDLTLVDGVTDVSADGAALELDLTLVEGSASSSENGTANGDTVSVGVQVIAGTAEGGFVRITGGMPFGPSAPRHRAVVSAVARGATLTLLASVRPGVAFGAKLEVVQDVPAPPLAAPAQVVHATASERSTVRQMLVEAGRASGDALAYGQMIEIRDWRSYDDDVLLLVL